MVYIPNGKLSSDTIINYSEKPNRRLDLSFSISYDTPPEKAIRIISDAIAEHPLALAEPEPNIRISAFGDSAVEIIARPWVASEDYCQLKFDILETVGQNFKEQGIVIPYNQLDVHIKNEKTP